MPQSNKNSVKNQFIYLPNGMVEALQGTKLSSGALALHALKQPKKGYIALRAIGKERSISATAAFCSDLAALNLKKGNGDTAPLFKHIAKKEGKSVLSYTLTPYATKKLKKPWKSGKFTMLDTKTLAELTGRYTKSLYYLLAQLQHLPRKRGKVELFWNWNTLQNKLGCSHKTLKRFKYQVLLPALAQLKAKGLFEATVKVSKGKLKLRFVPIPRPKESEKPAPDPFAAFEHTRLPDERAFLANTLAHAVPKTVATAIADDIGKDIIDRWQQANGNDEKRQRLIQRLIATGMSHAKATELIGQYGVVPLFRLLFTMRDQKNLHNKAAWLIAQTRKLC